MYRKQEGKVPVEKFLLSVTDKDSHINHRREKRVLCFFPLVLLRQSRL